MLAGVPWSQIMSFSGYLEAKGRVLSFAGVDEFNA